LSSFSAKSSRVAVFYVMTADPLNLATANFSTFE
jgi:hypothetical protein